MQMCIALSGIGGNLRAIWGICMSHVSSASPSNQGGNCFWICPLIATAPPTRLKLSKPVPRLVCMLKLDVQAQLCSRDHPHWLSGLQFRSSISHRCTCGTLPACHNHGVFEIGVCIFKDYRQTARHSLNCKGRLHSLSCLVLPCLAPDSLLNTCNGFPPQAQSL